MSRRFDKVRWRTDRQTDGQKRSIYRACIVSDSIDSRRDSNNTSIGTMHQQSYDRCDCERVKLVHYLPLWLWLDYFPPFSRTLALRPLCSSLQHSTVLRLHFVKKSETFKILLTQRAVLLTSTWVPSPSPSPGTQPSRPSTSPSTQTASPSPSQVVTVSCMRGAPRKSRGQSKKFSVLRVGICALKFDMHASGTIGYEYSKPIGLCLWHITSSYALTVY